MKETKCLNLLISTINNRIQGLKKIIIKKENVVFTVSHQITDQLDDATKAYIDEISVLGNVIYSPINSQGVAKNRNNALKHRVKGAICMLADDDVVYFNDAFSKIISLFEADKGIEILTFKIKTFRGSDYKSYKKFPFKHNIKTLSNIGIIDVAFKEEVIAKYNLSFDEKFGPGGYYSIGEDFIFMTDAIKKKVNIFYRPVDIVQHGDVGTGQILRDDIVYGRGAMFGRVFGLLSFTLNVYFAIKNFKKYKSRYSFLEYSGLLFKGSFNYLMSKR